jgi:hypothetical protein
MSEKRSDQQKVATGEELSTDDILLEQQNNLYDFSFEAIDLDTKFRSMNTNDLDSYHNEATLFRSSQQQQQQSQKFQSPQATGKGVNFHDLNVETPRGGLSSLEVAIAVANDLENIQIPPKPFFINSLQFLCHLQFKDLFVKLESKLNSILEISFVFHRDRCCVSPLPLSLSL